MTQQPLPTTSSRAAQTPAETPRRVVLGRFVRHYVEMVLAMIAGMVVLDGGLRLALGAAGITFSSRAHPFAAATEMTVTMAVGMAAWMRYRRHHRRHVAEMSAAMVVPLAVLFPLAVAGATGPGSLPALTHGVMFPLMLLVMLRDPHAWTGPVTGRFRPGPGLRRALRRGLWVAGVTAVAVAVPLGAGFAALDARRAESYSPAGPAGQRPLATTAAAPLPAHDPRLPTAVVVVGTRGAVAGDTLAPFETLAASGAVNTYLVAPGRAPVTLSGGLDVLPQLSFAELAARLGGRAPDAVVVPAMPDAGEPSNAPVRTWLTAQRDAGSVVVSVCAGAEVLASAGLLDGRPATSHWYRVAELERAHPGTGWRRGVRYVDDGDVVTTAGILSGIDGALRIVERLAGPGTAGRAAQAVGWRHYSPGRPAAIPVRSTGPGDAVVLLNAGFRTRPTLGVRLADGVGELAAAAVFDTYAGESFATRTLSVAPGRRPVTSRHGLTFLPRSTPDDATLDRTVVPATRGTAFPYDAAIADLARTVALDPAVVSEIVGRRRRDDPLVLLTPREREVLGLMAEGRSNQGIAERLVVTERAVEKHVTSIFGKLSLPALPADHRRVLAVLTFLRA